MTYAGPARAAAAEQLMCFLRSFFHAPNRWNRTLCLVEERNPLAWRQTFLACANSEILPSRCDKESLTYFRGKSIISLLPDLSITDFWSFGKTFMDVPVDQSVESTKPITEFCSWRAWRQVRLKKIIVIWLIQGNSAWCSHGKYDFAEASKNLAGYRAEHNFVGPSN